MWLIYAIIALLLLAAELIYIRIADRSNIIDKPNERSSHSTIVLWGGGIIFSLSMMVWAVLMLVQGKEVVSYLPFLGGLVLIILGPCFKICSAKAPYMIEESYLLLKGMEGIFGAR